MPKKVVVIIEALEVVTLRESCKIQRLQPGDWTVLSEAQLAIVLQKARGKVRVVSRRTIDPSAPSSGAPLSFAYWKGRSGAICGPGIVDPFVTAGDGLWLVIEHDGEWAWVHSGSLRSKLEFEQQHSVRAEEPDRELKATPNREESR